jgi:hypothetical protein
MRTLTITQDGEGHVRIEKAGDIGRVEIMGMLEMARLIIRHDITFQVDEKEAPDDPA